MVVCRKGLWLGQGRMVTPIAKWQRQRYVRKMLNKRLMHNLFGARGMGRRVLGLQVRLYNPFIAVSRGEVAGRLYNGQRPGRTKDNGQTAGRYGHNV